MARGLKSWLLSGGCEWDEVMERAMLKATTGRRLYTMSSAGFIMERPHLISCCDAGVGWGYLVA